MLLTKRLKRLKYYHHSCCFDQLNYHLNYIYLKMDFLTFVLLQHILHKMILLRVDYLLQEFHHNLYSIKFGKLKIYRNKTVKIVHTSLLICFEFDGFNEDFLFNFILAA
jgi:hypothetical protein